MCLISCNTFQKHLLSQKENLIFWPQKWIFEISGAIFDSFWHPNMRKRHCKATLKVSKKILRPSIKNRLDTFVPNVLGINLIPFSWSYDQNWLRETLKTEKKAKTPAKWTFWNIGFICWPNVDQRHMGYSKIICRSPNSLRYIMKSIKHSYPFVTFLSQ